jgi:hypothetical protein
MKYIFTFILLIHAFIHVMGFAKAFGYGNITNITKEISKPMGMLWLTAIALSIGISGGLMGLFFGFWLSMAIDQIPFNTAALPTIKTYPINYNPVFFLIGSTFSIITTFFAGWSPSRKASKVDPVVIIRGK